MIIDTLDQALVAILRLILSKGAVVCPRGQETRETLCCNFRLTNPRARCVTLVSRHWNFALAVGEFCWHTAGSDSLEFISYYSKMWNSFSDDGVHIRGSCYGRKIFNAKPNELCQWEKLKDQLRRDPSSRRAVLSFLDRDYNPSTEAIDIACINSIQFLLRDGKLHCITTMRSNDLIWGLCYDVFMVTMLQERLALELGVELGWYEHYSASMHIYSRHYEMAAKIASEKASQSPSMNKMECIESIPDFLAAERALREGNENGLEMAEALPAYWRGMGSSFICFFKNKRGGGGGSCLPPRAKLKRLALR